MFSGDSASIDNGYFNQGTCDIVADMLQTYTTNSDIRNCDRGTDTETELTKALACGIGGCRVDEVVATLCQNHVSTHTALQTAATAGVNWDSFPGVTGR